jgi:germination protein M
MQQRAKSSTRARLTAVVLCATVLAVGLAACGDDDGGTATTGTTTTSSPESSSSSSSTTSTTTAPIDADASLVYFTRGEHLAVAGRDLTGGGEGPDRLEAAMRAVLDGPSAFEQDEAGLATAVPEGSSLLGVTVEGDLATVDLASSFGSGGGSLSMRMRVAQLVYTATELEGVERVTITIDGETVAGLGGEGVAVDDLDRSGFDDLLPPILVQRPVPGQAIDRSLDVSGLANVFEGTVTIEVIDEGGDVVASGFGTGAMGEWLPFDATLTIPEDVDGELVVRSFEESAEDGSRQKVIEVPVTLPT